MRQWSLSAAWVCAVCTIFHYVLESLGVQIRGVRDGDDGPEYVDGSEYVTWANSSANDLHIVSGTDSKDSMAWLKPEKSSGGQSNPTTDIHSFPKSGQETSEGSPHGDGVDENQSLGSARTNPIPDIQRHARAPHGTWTNASMDNLPGVIVKSKRDSLVWYESEKVSVGVGQTVFNVDTGSFSKSLHGDHETSEHKHISDSFAEHDPDEFAETFHGKSAGSQHVTRIGGGSPMGSARPNLSMGAADHFKLRDDVWANLSASTLPDAPVKRKSNAMVQINSAMAESEGLKANDDEQSVLPNVGRSAGAQTITNTGTPHSVEAPATDEGSTATNEKRAQQSNAAAGGAGEGPIPPEQSVSFNASSSSGPALGLVVGGLFLVAVCGIMYAEMVMPDASSSDVPTYRHPRATGFPRKPPPQPQEQPADRSPRSPVAALRAQAHGSSSPIRFPPSRASAASEGSLYASLDNYRAGGSDVYSDSGSALLRGWGGSAGGVASGIKPAMLCADLTVPLCESWFGLPLPQLESATHAAQAENQTSSVPILGLQERPLLYATIMPGMLSLSVKPDGGILGQLKQPPGGIAQVLGKGNTLYGTFQCIGPLTYLLKHGGREETRLMFEERSCRMLLVSSADGGILASATRSHDTRQGDERLEVCVVAGMDPVLSLLCIVGSMVFAGPVSSY